MRRRALHLTCFIIGLALCTVPGVDARAASDAKVTLRKPVTGTSRLGLPAPHVQPRAPLPLLFVAPGAAHSPRLASSGTAPRRVRREPAPETSWRARAHPAQAPPTEG